MVINVLETKDLLELSLLKCKICDRRLQSPILQVSGFANVCGSCTCDTSTERNVELEALLQKLYLPCNYAGRGCEFEGSFDEVCIHEKRCGFQQLKCPLASYEQCDGDLDNIIEHIESKHPDNVVTAVGNHVSVKNPNTAVRSVIYLLVVDNLRFVLSAQLDVTKGHILYAFYCLNYDYINRDDVKVSILLKYENTNCNVDNIHVKQLRKGELPHMLYEDDIVKLKCIVLESFGCTDTINIKIDTAKSVLIENVTAKLNKRVTPLYKCRNCSAIAKTIHYCSTTENIICCEKCFVHDYDCYCSCGIQYNDTRCHPNSEPHIRIYLSSFNLLTTLACTNTGCREEIHPDNYDTHTKSECRFRQVTCSFSPNSSCKWTGAFIDLISHIREEHADRINRNSCQIHNRNGTLQQLGFIVVILCAPPTSSTTSPVYISDCGIPAEQNTASYCAEIKMVINVLDTKDLLELSLLKCKICDRRLQSPILQVSGFANVCGSCTSDTNAERNVDLEALLQKLYLPCNYAERGCEFEGSFDDICIHEKTCGFQKLKCPLASYEQCDGDVDNIIQHMESKHPDNVLTAVTNHVSVKNPNAEVRSVFYMLVVDNLRFILSAELDVKKGHILYAFYCLNYDYIYRDDVKISILLKYEDTIWNTANIRVNQLRKGEVPHTSCEDDVVKLKYSVLESFNCTDTITIEIQCPRKF
ncbi:Seven in absentia protein family [Popillia japonica]|uniref:Seven in absentia protein family n=1 Tax=Popillia japonica TaxID=7064 RepID=A0AAW1KPN5_POPJA